MNSFMSCVLFLLAFFGFNSPARASACCAPVDTATVTVTVRDSAGRLVPGARIEVRQGISQTLVAVRSTNAQGQVTLVLTPGSNYSIRAIHGSHSFTWYGSLRAGTNPPIAIRLSIWR